MVFDRDLLQHVQRRVDVVVRQRAYVLQLLPSENQTLLVRGNSFFILDLRLYIFNRIRGFHLKGDGLTRQSFHEDLHVAYESDSRLIWHTTFINCYDLTRV